MGFLCIFLYNKTFNPLTQKLLNFKLTKQIPNIHLFSCVILVSFLSLSTIAFQEENIYLLLSTNQNSKLIKPIIIVYFYNIFPPTFLQGRLSFSYFVCCFNNIFCFYFVFLEIIHHSWIL